MGDPKKRKKQYRTPKIPWEADRLAVESQLIPEYGLKNKTELWKMNSLLSSFSQQAKRLVAAETPQTILERKQLLAKTSSLGLVSSTAQLEDVLALDLKKILDRRLQTMVFRKGLARSIKQARQFITHGHIAIGNKLITIPSYLVLKSEEDKIAFIPTSQLSNSEHPERVVVKQVPPTEPEPKVKEEKAEEKSEKKKEQKKKKSEAKPKKQKKKKEPKEKKQGKK